MSEMKRDLAINSGHRLVRASIADNTRRAYLRAMRDLEDWLDVNGRTISDDAIRGYLIELFEAGRAPATAQQIVAAVEFRAKLHQEPSPVGPMTRRVLAGFARLGAGRGRGQATGLRWEDADRIARHAASEGLTGLRDAAVVAVMSDAMLRVSEAAAIDVDHIRPSPGGATLFVPRSKSDQAGEGATQYLGRTTIELVQRWRDAAGIHDGPLFRAVYRDAVKARAITAKTVTRIIQRRAAECGLDDGVSGHSLRVGAAQSLAAGGASLVEMQVEGRWKSTRMPARYAAGEMAERGAVARLRYGR